MADADPFQTLIETFQKLPGVGRKTAARFAGYLLSAPPGYAHDLAQAIETVARDVTLCSQCFAITTEDPCALCADDARDRSRICVVEEVHDRDAIEHTGAYKGLYHVLHGTISPLDNQGPDDLHLNEIVARIRAAADSETPVTEVILATNPTIEGDATALYLKKKLADIGVSVTQLARGVPTGGDLEYLDDSTLTAALSHRSKL